MFEFKLNLWSEISNLKDLFPSWTGEMWKDLKSQVHNTFYFKDFLPSWIDTMFCFILVPEMVLSFKNGWNVNLHTLAKTEIIYLPKKVAMNFT